MINLLILVENLKSGNVNFWPPKKGVRGSKKISPDFMSYLGPKKPKETKKSKLTLRLNRVTQHTTLTAQAARDPEDIYTTPDCAKTIRWTTYLKVPR